MTTRERFNKVLHWQKPDRIPNMEFGYWDETITVWHRQGLPLEVKTSEDMERYLGLEGTDTIPWVPAKIGILPKFEYKIFEERDDYRIIQNEDGAICKVYKMGESMPQYIKFGLENHDDWERYKKERLDYTREDRIGDFKAVVEKAHAAGSPVRFDAGSIYGLLRNWMGVENLSIAIMTDRKWVEEMMEHLTEMTLYFIEKTLPDVDVDVAWWWEDMCYNKGPLLSPKHFEELMVPRYRRITAALKKHHIDINILDCDGCIYELVPGWLKAGINCMFPIEVAHTDPWQLREKYGTDLLLIGGVNKLALINGKTAIDREIERLQPLVEKGGYIPTVDHRVPPDVSFENYLYYLERKKEIL